MSISFDQDSHLLNVQGFDHLTPDSKEVLAAASADASAQGFNTSADERLAIVSPLYSTAVRAHFLLYIIYILNILV